MIIYIDNKEYSMTYEKNLLDSLKKINESKDKTEFKSILESEYNDKELVNSIEENLDVALKEGFVDRIVEKGINKYPMMFLEKDQQRYVFVKTDKGIQWILFYGNKKQDDGKIQNDMAGEQFIKSLQDQGFKAIKREGSIKKFFKSIGRGLSMLLSVYGAVGIFGAVLLIMAVVLVPGIFGSAAAGGMILQGSVAQMGISLTSLGSGWIIGKLSKKKDNAPKGNNMNINESEEYIKKKVQDEIEKYISNSNKDKE